MPCKHFVCVLFLNRRACHLFLSIFLHCRRRPYHNFTFISITVSHPDLTYQTRLSIMSDTVPNTPQPFDEVANIVNKDGAFALLRPFNNNARDTFDATVNLIMEDMTNLEYFRQFLHLDGRVPNSGSFYTEDEDDGSSSGSDKTQWSGAFLFSLSLLPSHAPNWFLGTDQIPQKNDILLAPSSSSWKKLRIARRHARLYLHQESYRFMLEAHHCVTIGKNRARVLTKSHSHVLEHGELLIVGDCLYLRIYRFCSDCGLRNRTFQVHEEAFRFSVAASTSLAYLGR